METTLPSSASNNQISKSLAGIYACRIDTPLGSMAAAATDKGLALLEFGGIEQISRTLDQMAKAGAVAWVEQRHSVTHPILLQVAKELEAYYAGALKIFTVPLDFSLSGNDFARSVWEVLLKIPYGTTWTYKQQAEFMNNPQAIRAIASANGRNPIAVIVPCHRVIGSNGSLTGYAGGVERKRWLLLMEKNNSPVQAGKLF